jgi:hypothetical protein
MKCFFPSAEFHGIWIVILMCLSSLLIMSVSDTGYTKNVSCALNWISTFLLNIITDLIRDFCFVLSIYILSLSSIKLNGPRLSVPVED